MLNNSITLTQLTPADIENIMFGAINRYFENKPLPLDENGEANDLCNIDEAAQILGKAKTTIYGMTSNGSDLPYMKRGNKLYFSRKALLQWIAAGRRKTQSDLTADAESYLATR